MICSICKRELTSDEEHSKITEKVSFYFYMIYKEIITLLHLLN